ncbi:MAG: methyl-accepting chemotaxis protein [Spirochaetaceae bacterium]
MKIKELYKDADYETQMKAPILKVLNIGLAIAMLPVLLNNIVSKNYLVFGLFSLIIVAMLISLFLLHKKKYQLACSYTIYTFAGIIVLSGLMNKINGEQHFMVYASIGIMLVILSTVFSNTIKQHKIIIIFYSVFYFSDIIRRIMFKEVTELTRTLQQQLTAPLVIYVISLLLLIKYGIIVSKTISDTLDKITESEEKEDKLKEIIVQSNSQFKQTNKIKDNIEEATNSVTTIENSVNQVKDKVTSLSTQFHISEESLQQISESVLTLEKISDSTSANIVETSASLEEMVASIKNVSNIINNKVVAVAKLKTTADTGAAVISKTKDSFQQVIDHIDNIKNMTTTISKISSQTNLLAMNAAIEAAHAGESGKGFAVVADEVRKLAESSAMNVKQISETLKELISAINTTDKNVQNSGDAFISISENVKDVDEAMHEINTSVNELSVGSDELLGATSSMNNLTAQVNDAVKVVQINDDKVMKNFSEMGSFVVTLNSSMDEISNGNKTVHNEMVKLTQMSEELSNYAEKLGDELNEV